jgi:endogenous inhibitor of DNA gyrase (YacG/DUF329 family)
MKDKPSQNPCPNCGDQPEASYAPFCSRRCAEVDLGHWFNENYVVAGRAAEDIGGDED